MNLGTIVFGGLAIISLVSMLAKRPWTIIPARRSYPPQVWATDLFLETNMVVTGVWTFLFAIAAVLASFVPAWVHVIFGVSFAALGSVSHRFGSWYSARRLKAMGS